MQTILLVIHIFIALALVGIILIQRSSNDGLGLGGGGNNFLSGRASANLLTRTTAILAIAFMTNSMVLAYMASHTSQSSSLIERIMQEQKVEPVKTETPEKPKEPSVPIAQ